MLVSIGTTCRDAGDPQASAEVLSYAAKRLPHSYSVRYMLGMDLLKCDRVSDAAEHLQWCAQRDPNNEVLRKIAMNAMTDRIKNSNSVNRDVEQTGFRR